MFSGTRCNSSNAYLKPIKEERKQQLRIETGAMVTKVIFEGTKAVGVEYQQNDKVREIIM